MEDKILKYKDAVCGYIEAHKEELIADVCALCRINSEKAQAQEGAPFGRGAAQALERALKMAEGSGFNIKSYDGYVGTADFDAALPAQLDILAHLDVVPAGSGWSITEPFAPLIKDGRIYGRGTSDDKGPAAAALYALKAVRELGIPLKGNIRLILGTDEECGSSDIAYYYSKEKEAPMTFSPDAEFPVVNIEKGRLHGRLFRKFTGSSAAHVLSADAGIKVNVVPANAGAKFPTSAADALKAATQEISLKTGVQFEIKESAEGVFVSACGKGAHASTPEGGNNALTALLELMGSVLPEGEQAQAAKALAELFPHGDVSGRALGISMEDSISGKLTLALSMLHMDAAGISAEFDCRIPVCGDGTDISGMIREKAAAVGFEFEVMAQTKAHNVPGDSDFVRTLLAAYEAVTGEKGECIAMGGGTYVHDLEHGVAFGAIMPGTDTRMHGPDEFAVIEELISAAKIYALAIAQLCG